MQIKGNCFIPPTNLLWLPATGLWGEIQPRRKPESKSLCAKCSLQDGFAAAAAERCLIPWRGYSAWRKRCGGVRLAEESWDGAVSLGTGLGTQGWQCPGGCGKRGRDRVSEDILVMAKGEGTQERARSCSCTEWAAWVRASPQTVNSSKANKKKQGFRGTERIHGFGSNSAKYF